MAGLKVNVHGEARLPLMETSGASVARAPPTRASHPECRCSASFETPLTATISRPLLPQATSTCRTSTGSPRPSSSSTSSSSTGCPRPSRRSWCVPYPSPHPSPTVGCRQLSCRPRHARDLPTRVRRLARETLPEPRPPPCLPPCSSSDSTRSRPLATQVLNLLDDAKAGRPLKAPALPATPTGQSPSRRRPPKRCSTARRSPRRHSPRRRAPPSPGLPVPPPGAPPPPPPPPPPQPRARAADAIPRFYRGVESDRTRTKRPR